MFWKLQKTSVSHVSRKTEFRAIRCIRYHSIQLFLLEIKTEVQKDKSFRVTWLDSSRAEIRTTNLKLTCSFLKSNRWNICNWKALNRLALNICLENDKPDLSPLKFLPFHFLFSLKFSQIRLLKRKTTWLNCSPPYLNVQAVCVTPFGHQKELKAATQSKFPFCTQVLSSLKSLRLNIGRRSWKQEAETGLPLT